jgi:hypothetical protein
VLQQLNRDDRAGEVIVEVGVEMSFVHAINGRATTEIVARAKAAVERAALAMAGM